jgi:rubrerythrin
MLKRIHIGETARMSEFLGHNSVLIDGYTGLPTEIEPERGPREGTVEWLLDAVERHAAGEQDALGLYAEIGRVSGDPAISLVMGLILDDEERHHGLLRRIESSLRDALYWTHSPNSLPDAAAPQQPVTSELAEIVRALISEERSGARHMRELSRNEKGIGSGLHTVLLEMMAMDSEKHARLLQFVHERLLARARQEDGPAD